MPIWCVFSQCRCFFRFPLKLFQVRAGYTLFYMFVSPGLSALKGFKRVLAFLKVFKLDLDSSIQVLSTKKVISHVGMLQFYPAEHAVTCAESKRIN